MPDSHIELICILYPMHRIISRLPLELIAWSVALAYLALIDPDGSVPQFCLSKFAGLGECPGCGLGGAVSHLLHGEFSESWKSHWLGGPTLIVLLMRIGQLLKMHKTIQAPQ